MSAGRLRNRGFQVFIVDWGVRKHDYNEYFGLLDPFSLFIKRQLTSCMRKSDNLYFDIKMPYVESFLALARHAIDWERIIKPRLQRRNVIILADRDVDTLYAHQLISFQETQRVADKHVLLNQMRNIVLTWFKEPDLTFYIKIPVEVAMKRLRERGRQLSEHDMNYLVMSMKNYDFLANLFKNRYIVVDGTKSADEICESIIQKIFLFLRSH